MGRKDAMDARQQRELPFAAGQGAYDEAKNLLGLALLRVGADLHLAQFMLWLFNTTEGGRRGALKKSYEQLAARPWGLCCSPAKARATVREARRQRLCHIEETWTAEGIQGSNSYRYDRALIQAIVENRRVSPPALPDQALGATEQALGATDQALGATEQALGATHQAHIRNNTFSHLSSPSCTFSVSRSIDRPIEVLDEQADLRADVQTRPAAGGAGPARGEAIQARRQQIAAALQNAGVWQVPALREARQHAVAPLPPEVLVYDALAPLKPEHLTRADDLTRWFRRQLSIDRPFTGDSQAELVLVLAAGIATAAVPAAEIRKDRMAIFKATLARGLWPPVMRHVPQAIAELARLQQVFPECLTSPEWPGPRAAAAIPFQETQT